jgi:hypothetical protein
LHGKKKSADSAPWVGLELGLDAAIKGELVVLDPVDPVGGEGDVAVLVDRIGAEHALAVLGREQLIDDGGAVAAVLAGALDVLEELDGVVGGEEQRPARRWRQVDRWLVVSARLPGLTVAGPGASFGPETSHMRGSGSYPVAWPQCSPGRGVGAFLAVLGALAWSLGFAIWAYVGAAGTECTLMPAGETTCRSTPLAHGFGRELLAVLVPAMVCLLVWVLLRRYCTRGGWLARGVAAALAALFVAFCWLAALSVGPLLLPIAVLLVVAVAATEPPAPTGSGPLH